VIAKISVTNNVWSTYKDASSKQFSAQICASSSILFTKTP
jgi:hypothetical protein